MRGDLSRAGPAQTHDHPSHPREPAREPGPPQQPPDAAGQEGSHLLRSPTPGRAPAGEPDPGSRWRGRDPPPQPRDPTSGQEEIGGDTKPGHPGHRPVQRASGRTWAPHVDEPSFAALGDEADVALEGEGREPDPDGVAVDRCDHRLADVERGGSNGERWKSPPVSASKVASPPDTSAPAQKASPAPVTTTTGRHRRRRTPRMPGPALHPSGP